MAVEAKDLRFNDKGKFKMVQFTDMHFCEEDRYDVQNQKLMGEILDQEKPDIVIITGDVVTGWKYDGGSKCNVKEYWTKGMQPMVERGINWAATAGNHDS
jgi:predicted MPP superfamily phosphohydrolase